MTLTPLPAWTARANTAAAPAIVGHKGKAFVTDCVHCGAETVVKVRKRTILAWNCPKCGSFNRTERGE